MSLNLKFIVAALAMLVVTAAAQAQDNRQALAEQVVRESGADSMMIQTIQATSPLIIEAFRADVPDLTQPEGEMIVGYFIDEIRTLMPQFIAEISAIYAQNFTEEELQQLLDFYRSPVGQRLIEVQPQIATQAQVVGERLGQQAMTNAMPQIQTLIENR
ncbi:DUF2059 domain-containing protein [Hyphobacterium sp.]|uniref:DUF2059 domain-containing protein n=1 Tax=Hyphobacterium sp. TaxID=2004662 RepID=UPI003BA89136